MVGRLSGARHDLHVSLRVTSRLAADRIEKLRRHRPRTGERGENAAGTQRLHGKKIDVLVSARRPNELSLGVGEFRRIEHYEIELPSLVSV